MENFRRLNTYDVDLNDGNFRQYLKEMGITDTSALDGDMLTELASGFAWSLHAHNADSNASIENGCRGSKSIGGTFFPVYPVGSNIPDECKGSSSSILRNSLTDEMICSPSQTPTVNLPSYNCPPTTHSDIIKKRKSFTDGLRSRV